MLGGLSEVERSGARGRPGIGGKIVGKENRRFPSLDILILKRGCHYN